MVAQTAKPSGGTQAERLRLRPQPMPSLDGNRAGCRNRAAKFGPIHFVRVRGRGMPEVRPRKNRPRAPDNLQMLIGLSTSGSTSTCAKKRLPRQGRRLSGQCPMTPFGDEERMSVRRNLCGCCAEFCDRHHLLRSEGRPVDNRSDRLQGHGGLGFDPNPTSSGGIDHGQT